jgi:hypothetical protein
MYEEFFRRMLNAPPTHLTRHDPDSLSDVASRLNPFERDCFHALRRVDLRLTYILPLPATTEAGASPQEDVPEERERAQLEEVAKERLRALFQEAILVDEPSAFEQELLTLLRRIDRRLAKAFPLPRGGMKP